MKFNYAVVTPLANESEGFHVFIDVLTQVLKANASGKVYFVVDKASKDNTLILCRELSRKDKRFVTVWAPEDRNVVDAYIRGYKEALKNNHDFIIEMDAGLSHDPRELPKFLIALNEGYACAFGSRFIKGGCITNSNLKRTFLSRAGTLLSNTLLGTKMHDMTSGFQGFKANVASKFVEYQFLSTAHFYQTELRYLLRNTNFLEIPICYNSPSPRVSSKSIANSLYSLFHYFILRLQGKPIEIGQD